MRASALLLLAILSVPAPGIAEPLRIMGRIANPQGLQGIQVELRPYPLSYADALRQLKGEDVPPLALVKPAADGSFVLQVPESGFFWIRVRADGRLPMEHFLPLVVEDAELPTVELPAASPLEVRAAGPDGKPLAGVTIQASYSGPDAAWRQADRDAVTDPEGKATVPRSDTRAEGETLTLTVTAPGVYSTATISPSGRTQTVRFPATRSRTVEVRGSNGKPAAGALVRLVRRGRPLGLTGPDGRFAMPIPDQRELGLVVEDAKGLRLEVVMTQEAAEGTDVPVVTLRTPTAVTGRVLDGATRDPLAGALVWSGGSAWTRSGPQGDFELRAPSGDEGRVEALARGRMKDVQPWSRDRNTPLTLVLDPAGTIVGQVVDETGKPLARVRVRTYAWSQQGMGSPLDERTSWSGLDGRFMLRRLPAGRSHDITAVLEGFAPGRQSTDAPASGRSAKPVRIVLSRGSVAFGRVLNEDGLPVTGAEVNLSQPPGPSGLYDLEPLRAVSDGAGRFRFLHLSPGRFKLQAKRAGFAPAFREALEVPAKIQELDLGDITLESGAAIEGRVTDERGNPVARADVSLSPADDAGAFFGSGYEQALTGFDGRFRFQDLPRGRRFDLQVHHEGFVPANLPGVEPRSGSPLRVELREGRTLAGQVVDGEGEPIPKASISLVETTSVTLEGSGSSSSMTRDVARTDEEGRFLLADLEPGTVELQVDAPGYRPKRVPGLRIPEQGEAPLVEISLERGASIEGRVVDGQGRPARGAMVRAEGQRSEQGVLSYSGSRTDSDGRYRLEGLEAGPHLVQAESAERDLRAEKALEIRLGMNRLDLTFPSGVDVSGYVVDGSGDPVAGATIQLWPAEGTMARNSASSADGSFTFTDVSEGEYRLRGGARGFATSALPGMVRVGRNPVDGLELRLSPGAVIRGRILGLAPGEQDEVHVSAFSPDGGYPEQGIVDEEGSYRLDGVGPGEWVVMADLSSKAHAQGAAVVREGDEEVVLDLQLPEGFTLTGRVLLDRTPLPGALVSLRGGDPRQQQTGAEAQTAHDGSFSISHLPADSYTLVVSLSTGVGHIQAVEISGDQDLTIEVQTGTLEGRLLSAEGLPVAGAVISLTGENPDRQSEFQGPSTRSDDQGYFELPRLATGTYRVTAQAEGFAPAETRVVLTPGGTARVELILSR